MADAHTLDPTILREYDIRGVVGDTLTLADVRAVGRAFGTLVADDGGESVAVGYDGRLSSPELEAAAVEGLAAAGLSVTRVGRGPTPMLYYAAHTLATDAGVMITGSHNPPEYNGIKLVRRAKSVWGEQIREIGRVAAAGRFRTGRGDVSETAVLADYVERLARDFEPGRDLKVAWDAGNGATGEAVEMLTAMLAGEHVLLNTRIDGTFPAHHPDPTVEANLTQLKEAVAREGCDLGLAFDGDGDRIGVVDGLGRVLWGDQLLVIFAGEVLADVPGATVIADVKASRVFFDEVRRLGGKPLMWKTGHSLIKEKMRETGAPLAGEMSGHIFFAHRYYGYDDALYAAVRLLNIVGRSTETLAGMRDRLPAMVNTPELRIPCPEDRKFQVVEEVRDRIAAIEGLTVHDVDGVRVETDDGWWLLRASNTQAVLVARCESETEDGLGRLRDVLAEQLRRSGVEPPVDD